MQHQAYIALGANLGDAAVTLRAALAALRNCAGLRLDRASSLYLTAPVGLIHQPDFVNAVACAHTELAPEALLDALFDLEAQFGRVRGEKNGPRLLDLDLLLYDDLVQETSRLTLPHPRMHLRAFVLAPLAEIAPDLVIPGRGSVRAWLPAVAGQSITRLP